MGYQKNYLKIYLWQGISILTGFFAMFFVTPFLSADKNTYSIYSLCISLTIFLSYADLGFLGAGFKFAAECFSRGDRKGETKIVGFTAFVFFLLCLVYSFVILIFAVNPGLILSGPVDPSTRRIASRLLLILAVSSLNLIYQRILQLILGIRLQDFILRRIGILANVCSILSTLWFFRTGFYDIVGYYFFMQAAQAAVSIIVTILLIHRQGYPLRDCVAAFRFDQSIFRRMKLLAFSTLLSTLAWILYFELDSIFIAKAIGVMSLAYFAVCLTLVNFLRSIIGALYSPFQARFNHFLGESNPDGLRSFYQMVIRITLPIVILPIVTLFFLVKPFLLSWVGPGYSESIPVGRILVCIFLVACFQFPAGILLTAQQRNREIILLSVVNCVVFWSMVLLTYSRFGILSVAWSKLTTFCISGIYYFLISARFLGKKPFSFLWDTSKGLLIPIIFLAVVLSFLSPVFPPVKNPIVLLEVIGTGAVAAVASFLLYILFSGEYRGTLATIWNKRKHGTQG